MYYPGVKIIRRPYWVVGLPASGYLLVWMAFILIHLINRFFIRLTMDFKHLIFLADVKIHALYKQRMVYMCLLTHPGIIRCHVYPSLFLKTFFTGRKKGRHFQKHIIIVF